MEAKIRQRLWDAINADKVNTVRNILEEEDIDPDIMLCNESIPLIFLAKSYEMAKMLVERGADPDPLRHSSPLIKMFRYGLYTEEDFEILKLYVKNGANIHKTCPEGYTVIDYAKALYVREGDKERQKLKEDTIKFLESI